MTRENQMAWIVANAPPRVFSYVSNLLAEQNKARALLLQAYDAHAAECVRCRMKMEREFPGWREGKTD